MQVASGSGCIISLVAQGADRRAAVKKYKLAVKTVLQITAVSTSPLHYVERLPLSPPLHCPRHYVERLPRSPLTTVLSTVLALPFR